MSNGLDKLANGMGKAIETVPDVYEDALKPATQESGKVLALIPRTINAALVPLRQWIANKEYNFAETEKLLAQKLEHVGEEKIVTPEYYVAIPTIQAISYSMNSSELRNLYANLLAKAMNSDTKDLVHPSFVEIIKQLSPTDSLVFKTIMERDANPLIDLVYQKFDNPNIPFPSSSITITTNISDIDIAPVESICVSIDNLIKQGLISIPDDSSYTDKHLYDKLITSQYYMDQKRKHPDKPDGFKFSYVPHLIEETNLGKSFYNVCAIDL